jgi:hypothetical protein
VCTRVYTRYHVHEKALLHAAVPFLFLAHQSPGTSILVYLCVCPRARIACVRACLHVCMCIHAGERERERERDICVTDAAGGAYAVLGSAVVALQKMHSAHAQYMNFAEYMDPICKNKPYIRTCVRVCAGGGRVCRARAPVLVFGECHALSTDATPLPPPGPKPYLDLYHRP